MSSLWTFPDLDQEKRIKDNKIVVIIEASQMGMPAEASHRASIQNSKLR